MMSFASVYVLVPTKGKQIGKGIYFRISLRSSVQVAPPVCVSACAWSPT
jgi:hypothetical protein